VITVTVFGLGFVGLTTALGFASLGHKVYGIDVDEKRKATLREKQLPFAEPGLGTVLESQLNNNFFITDDVAEAVQNSQYIYYCVGTPYGAEGNADLSYLYAAIQTTVDSLVDGDRKPLDSVYRVLITKSTIPPSTTSEKIVPFIMNMGEISNYLGIANNPEFLREGHCWDDFINADRIVIGCEDEKVKHMMDLLYAPMDSPIFYTNFNTGEFIKYLSNTMLATLISFSNEMAHIASSIGDIEVSKAFKILHMDKRWGGCMMTSYVYPGCGYGGYCLPKDTNALFAQSKKHGFEPTILREVIKTNDERPLVVSKEIAKVSSVNQKIGILGLSFKPMSDDVRDTPAAKIIQNLKYLGFRNIIAYDPIASKEFIMRYPDVEIEIKESMEDLYECADVICILTAWEEFKTVKTLGNKVVVDCRYML